MRSTDERQLNKDNWRGVFLLSELLKKIYKYSNKQFIFKSLHFPLVSVRLLDAFNLET
jgi:hypothetical protein